MLGDVKGTQDSLWHAEKIKAEVIAPLVLHEGELILSRFIFELYQLEEGMKKSDKPSSSLHSSSAFKVGDDALKIADKYALIKTEAFKLMGVYYWMIGKQRKAMQWWRKAIKEGQRLNDRLELSRTYYEVGKRLLEPKSKYKELDGIKADEYLEKARTMFEEMDLQWDLDELDKLKIHMGT